ncbi:type IV secretion system DNA-binding domain-containing protein [Patescibacteria group bacterium]|nr:type IV secretion system DNA-binding domain-containing protein [Patescibacteria group bacterium]
MPIFQGEHKFFAQYVDLMPPFPQGFFSLPEPTWVQPDPPPDGSMHKFLMRLGWAQPWPKLPPTFERVPDLPWNPPSPKKVPEPVELQMQFPSGKMPSREEWEAAVWKLAACPYISFEVVALDGHVKFQFACEEINRRAVRSVLEEHLEGVSLIETRGELHDRYCKTFGRSLEMSDVIYDYGFARDFLLPLRFWQPNDDPLEPFVDMLLDLGASECGSLQVFFQELPGWMNDGIHKLWQWDVEARHMNYPRLFPDSEEEATERKLSRPLLAARVRMMVCAKGETRMNVIVESIDKCLQSQREKSGNYLGRWHTSGKSVRHGGVNRSDFVWRISSRPGMLFSRDEVLSFVHLPPGRLRHPQIRLLPARTKAAPSGYVHAEVKSLHPGQVLLGINRHEERRDAVVVGNEVRSRHTHIIGASGTGKSSLLFNLIIMDIFSGGGVAVIDPHGDLIDKVLEYIPEHRRDDVLLLDPSDAQYPIGFNILAARSDAEKTVLATDLVAVFRRLSTTWGDQMNTVLANAILAILESSRGGTLIDLRNFLAEKDFRLKFLETVRDENVRHYWLKQFPLLSGHPQAPILTRLNAFLLPKMIRHMVMQKDNKLNFPALMNGKKIVLAKLTHGAIGAENAYLLGSLLVSGFYAAALGRHSMAKENRSLFNLYMDEFHNFVTPSISSILSGGRKYGLGLTLAHQDLQQLSSRDEELASAVLSNAAVRVCYRVGEQDAKKLAEGFSFFTAGDILNLQRGEAACRIDTKNNDFNLDTVPLDLIFGELGVKSGEEQKGLTIAASRAHYATPLATLSPEPGEPLSSVNESPKTDLPAPVEKPRPRPEVKPRPATPKEKRQHDEAMPASSKAEAVSPEGGKGLHDYFKRLITNRGEELGYFVEKEKTVLNGAGRVDVLLTRDKKTIACEISVTNSPGYEVENIKKCLAAGFDIVAFITNEQKKLNQVRRLAADIEAEGRAKLRFFSPEEFDVFLEEQAAKEVSSESVTRGRSVKTNYKTPSAKDTAARKKVISKIIAAAIKRLKGDQ